MAGHQLSLFQCMDSQNTATKQVKLDYDRSTDEDCRSSSPGIDDHDDSDPDCHSELDEPTANSSHLFPVTKLILLRLGTLLVLLL